MPREISRVDARIAGAISIERPLKNTAQLDASICFR
jgi:hypothetical protein